MQDPEASFSSIMGSCWTLPGSRIGKDNISEESKSLEKAGDAL